MNQKGLGSSGTMSSSRQDPDMKTLPGAQLCNYTFTERASLDVILREQNASWMLREMPWPLRSRGSGDKWSEASLGSHIEHWLGVIKLGLVQVKLGVLHPSRTRQDALVVTKVSL